MRSIERLISKLHSVRDAGDTGGSSSSIGNFADSIKGEGGGYSAVDEKGNFIGVVDDSLNGFERFGKNFATNFNIASQKFKDKGVAGMLSGVMSLMSPKTLALTGGLLLGKTLAQTLSSPGLTNNEKQAIKKAADVIDKLSPEDKAVLKDSFKTTADGKDNTDDNSTDTEEDQTSSDTGTSGDTEDPTSQSYWDRLQNEFFGDENNLKTLLEEDAGFTKNEAEGYNEKINTANDENNALLKQLMGEADSDTTAKDATSKYDELLSGLGVEAQNDTTVSDADAKHQALLDSLLGQQKYNTGLFKPIQFEAGGNNISRVPTSALNTILRVQDIGKQGYDSSVTLAEKLAALRKEREGYGNSSYNAGMDLSDENAKNRAERSGYGNDIYANTNETAKNVYDNAQDRNPANAQKKYIQALLGMIPMEEGKRQFDDDLAYRREALKKNLALKNRELDQDEPGLWSYLGEGLNLFNNASDWLNL